MNSPYIGNFRVTSVYGSRSNPFTGKSEHHDGLDLVGIDSKEIHSTVNGTVIFAGWENPSDKKQGFGQYIKIKQTGTEDVYYFGHLSEIKVKAGDTVKPSQIIGIEGTTGSSTGSHLHYCIRIGGVKGNDRNVSAVSGIPNKLGIYNEEDLSASKGAERETAMRIYLSPSNQPGNKYCAGNTNEKAEMEAVAKLVKEKLDREYDCETVLATLSLEVGTSSGRTKEAADRQCNVYVAIHSNAGANGNTVTAGAVCLYHPDSAKSKELAEKVVKELNAVCPIKSNRSSPAVNGMIAFNGAGYGEIREPMKKNIPAVLLEVDFHDNPKTAQWIIDSKPVIADAIVKSLADTFGIKKKTTESPAVPPVTPPASPDKLYRVQVGVYAVKENAEAMLAKLKAAGYDAYIKYE